MTSMCQLSLYMSSIFPLALFSHLPSVRKHTPASKRIFTKAAYYGVWVLDLGDGKLAHDDDRIT